MTINDLHNAVKIELDKTSSLELPAFEQEEIDYWLDQAILRYVEEKYNQYISGSSVSKLQDELKYLMTHYTDLTVTVTANTETGKSKLFSLLCSTATISTTFIMDLMVKLTSRTMEDGTTATLSWQKCKRINPNDTEKYLSTTHNTPYFEQPVFYLNYTASTGTSFIVITDSFTTGLETAIEVSYLRTPVKVSTVTRTNEYTDLPAHTHHDIVKLATFMMLENIESQRASSISSFVNNNL